MRQLTTHQPISKPKDNLAKRLVQVEAETVINNQLGVLDA